MKKCLIFLIVILMFTHSAYADATKWDIVDKGITNGIDYSTKVGNYFFGFKKTYDEKRFVEVSNLLYSTDGIIFVETDYITSSLPILADGKYFLFDSSLENIPESKRTSGFTNSPSYILDKNLKVINKLEHNCYAKYKGYYNGQHYIEYNDYNDITYDNGWKGEKSTSVYKSKNCRQFKRINNKEDVSFLNGTVLYDDSILYTSFSSNNKEKNKLHLKESVFDVTLENDSYVGKTYLTKNIPLFIMNYNDEEFVSEWYDDRKKIERKSRKYVSLDGVYGVEMPDDIGRYCFEMDNKFYFEKDDNSYYCISKDELSNKTKVIYENQILAFDVEPQNENNRILVPMRFMFEKMGADVSWDDKKAEATVKNDKHQIKFVIDKNDVIIDGETKKMDVPARIIKGKTMIPIRFLSEQLGYNVIWDEEYNAVRITKGDR